MFRTTVRQLSDDTIATALLAANVDATRYETTQVNAIKKENFILSYLFERNATLQNYIAEIFASAYTQQKLDADAFFTKDDAKNVLNASHAVTEAQATFYSTIKAHIDESTINAQHKSTLDALVSLNVFVYHSTLAAKHAYKVNFANELTTRFAEKLNIVIADESDDAA